jgi:hypothetical protein
MDQLTAARPCATIWLECEQDFDRRALILRWGLDFVGQFPQ